MLSAVLWLGCSANPTRNEPRAVEQPMEQANEANTSDANASGDKSTVSESNNQPAEQAHAGPGQHRHRHRGHRFDKPERYAKRWNDPARAQWQKPEEVIELMSVQPGMTVADIGTGTGYFVPFLSEAVGDEGMVYALDIEPKMVKFVGDLAAEQGLKNVEAKQISADGPGVSGVDRFLLVNVWHHISERESYAAELAKALNAGGSVTIVDYVPDASMRHGPPRAMRLDPQTIIAELEAGGLDASLVEESLPRQYVVVARKQ
jgi:SAM-dependent methyltransferase